MQQFVITCRAAGMAIMHSYDACLVLQAARGQLGPLCERLSVTVRSIHQHVRLWFAVEFLTWW